MSRKTERSDSKLWAASPQALEPCDSCFQNQNKIGFSRYILCCNRTKKAKPRIAMFSRLCTDGPKGFLFGNFFCENFLQFSMQDFDLNAVSGVEINEGGREGNSKFILAAFFLIFQYS